MHIADGILSWPVLGAGAALSAGGVAWGLSRLRVEDLPKTACVSAAFFVASLIHVPLGPSSAHLLLCGLAGILLGQAVFPALFVALLLQALLFQFGGFLTLGINTFDMAFPALLLGILLRRPLAAAESRSAVLALGFSAGAGGVLLAAATAASALALSGRDFRVAGALLLLGHLPVALVEGVATAFITLSLKKIRPESFAEGRRAIEQEMEPQRQ